MFLLLTGLSEEMNDPGLISQAISNLLKISSPEDIGEICRLLNLDLVENPVVIASTEQERKQAELDQYADLVLAPEGPMEDDEKINFTEMAKYVPLRLEFEERRLLRLLESTIDSSEYTDRVEAAPPAVTAHQLHRHTATVLKNICSVLSGLVVAHAAAETSILTLRNFSDHKNLFQAVFEIARRYKILNPERIVVLPDLEAGCSLADQCPPDRFAAFRAARPDHKVVSYINCSAAVKAQSDVICTSSNAVDMVRLFPESQPFKGRTFFFLIYAFPLVRKGASVDRRDERGGRLRVWRRICFGGAQAALRDG
jgi:hypothetical protein